MCVTIVFCVIFPRAANVFSCAYLVNLVRPAHRQVPPKHQKALWYCGKEHYFFFIYLFNRIWREESIILE